MRVYTVRRSVLDMSIVQWGALDSLFPERAVVAITAEEFLEKVGLPSALSALCNEEEVEFFDKIYELERSKRRNMT